MNAGRSVSTLVEVAMPDANTDAATLLRVLLVDDSPWLRQSVRAALERAGVVVVGEAADGAQALTQAATHHPEIRVVLWTARDDAQLDSAIRRSGAHAGLAKGVRPVELIATLRAVR